MVRAVIWLASLLASLAVHSVLLLAVSGLAHQKETPPLAELLIGDGAVLPEAVTAQTAGGIAAAPAEIVTAQPAQSALNENGGTLVAPVTAAASHSAVESGTVAPAPSEERIAAVSPDESVSPQAVTETPAAAIAQEERAAVSETTGVAPLDAATPVRPAEQSAGINPANQLGEAPVADSPAVTPSIETPATAPSSEPPLAIATEPDAAGPTAPVSSGSVSTPVSGTPVAAPETTIATPAAPSTAAGVAPATDSSNQLPVTDTVNAAPETAQAAPSTLIAPAASQDATSSAQQAGEQLALGPITPPPESITERMHRFLRGYDGGGCFFAVPVALDSARPRIDGFGSTTDPIRTFGDEFKRTLGIEPQIEVRTITNAQCPAIHFIGGLLKSRFPELGVRLELDQIASGSQLRGSLEGVHLPWVYLVLIDDDGMVQDLSQYLSNADGHLTFSAPMTVKGQGQGRNQLLVGVATSRELSLLKTDKPIRGEDFLPAVVDEADRLGADVALGVGAFRVE